MPPSLVTEMINASDKWPEHKLVVTGQNGAGKSHLASIFATQTDAQVLQANDIPVDFQPIATTTIIEDMETLPRTSEEVVMEVVNSVPVPVEK